MGLHDELAQCHVLVRMLGEIGSYAVSAHTVLEHLAEQQLVDRTLGVAIDYRHKAEKARHLFGKLVGIGLYISFQLLDIE